MDFHKYTGDSYAVVFTKVMSICAISYILCCK